MAVDVMMQLGEFQFSIDTAAYQRLTDRMSWSWPSQSRLGAPDVYQFTGRQARTRTLAGTIYPQFRGAGPGQIDRMRAMADRGVPLRLVDGRGHIHGRWIITEVRERQPIHERQGVPRKQEFTLSITQADDDAGL